MAHGGMIETVWSPASRRAVVLVLALVSLSACAPKTQVSTTYYGTCYESIKYLEESQSKLVTTAVTGAAIGAAVGGLTGYLATGDAKGAVIGAAAGGVGGGLMGYAYGKQQQITDDKARWASYSNDIRKDIDDADRTVKFALQSKECYETQFSMLVADMKAGKIKKDEAQARFNEIKQGMTRVSEILGTVGNSMDEKTKSYQAALEDEAKKAKVEVASLQAPQAAALAVQAAPEPAPAPEPAAKPAKKTSTKTTSKKPAPAPTPVAAAPKPAPAPVKAEIQTSTVPAENASLALMKGDLDNVSRKKTEVASAKQSVDTKMMDMSAEFASMSS